MLSGPTTRRLSAENSLPSAPACPRSTLHRLSDRPGGRSAAGSARQAGHTGRSERVKCVFLQLLNSKLAALAALRRALCALPPSSGWPARRTRRHPLDRGRSNPRPRHHHGCCGRFAGVFSRAACRAFSSVAPQWPQ